MSKMTDIFDVWHFLTAHFVTGVVPFVSFVLLVLYVIGYSRNKEIVKSKESEKFSSKAYSLSPALSFFNGVNSALDFAVGGVLKAVHKFAWVPSMALLDKVIPDAAIDKVFQSLSKNEEIASLSFESRLKMAQEEFDKAEDAFWWNKERAPDFRNVSPIISGRWFNGKPVENYMPMLVAPRNFYQVVKAGVLVFVVAAVVSVAIYRPDMSFGFTPERVLADQIVAVVKNPAVWGSDQVTKDQKEDRAYSMVLGSDYTIIARVFFSLFFALGVAGVFVECRYFAIFKKLGIPFVKDNYEEFAYQNKLEEIRTYKRNLSAANIRATGFDRVTPLVVAFESTGAFEDKGILNTRRSGQKLTMSLTDMAQNTQIYGGIGSGKTELILKPIARAACMLKNQYIRYEDAYAELFDLRADTLTDKAIAEGYLKIYRKLPVPKISLGMTIMDIKSQLWKDLVDTIQVAHLQDRFQIIGPDVDAGELAVDPLATLDPAKLISFINTMKCQMGSDMGNDFWMMSGFDAVEHIANIAYLFARTTAARDYMRKHNIKVWSLMFIQDLAIYDNDYEMLHNCVAAIQSDLESYPERLADIFTVERVKSVEYMLTKWKTLANETKSGIEANMNAILKGYQNHKLAVFMTGVGDNIVEVGQLWNMLTAFNLDTDRYSNAGKFILLFVKTLIFEEAIKRQQRYATRIIQVSKIFEAEFPKDFVITPAIEIIPVNWLGREAQALADKYCEICDIIQSVEGQWVVGSYASKLQALAAQNTQDTQAESIHQMAREALALAEQIYKLEPRHAKECVSMVGFNPVVLNANHSDSPEQARRKEELMHLYYQYEDATTRVRREHMIFMGDEYQELITADKSGGCYNDSNFPKVSRSSGTKLVIATQTYAGYVEKVEKDVADAFINQMRNQFFLGSEDESTGKMVEALAGTVDVFDNPYKGIELKSAGKPTGVFGYNNFNSFVSRAANENKRKAGFNKAYEYDHDVFTEAEPLELPVTEFNFDNVVSSIFQTKPQLELVSMKQHFLDESKIPAYRRTGSASQGYQDNKDAIQSAWSESRDKMNSSYQSFLTQNVRKDVPAYRASEYVAQGNVHAFVIVQRAGMTIKDQVIVAPDHYYMN